MLFHATWALALHLALPAAAQEKTETGFTIEAPWGGKLKIGGQIRARVEWRDPRAYKTAAPGVTDESGDVGLLRTRLYLDAEISEHIRALVQIQDSRTWGEETAVNADMEGVDLKQGFLELRKLFDQPLSIRAGRMELPQLGDQRLISPLDWDNVGRSWDGIHIHYQPDGWSLLGIAVNTKAADKAGDDRLFAGLYASCRKIEDHEFDLYLFHRNDADGAFAAESGVTGDRKDFTVGFRAKGKLSGFAYTGEVVYQFGDRAGDDVRAWAFVLTAGYGFAAPWKPFVGIEYAFASGDEDAGDGELNRFDPLFPFGHSYHGHMDLIGWRNVHAAKLMLRAAPLEAVTVHLDLHGFWRAEKSDAWLNPGGAALRTDPTGAADRHIGYEIDLYAKWKLWGRALFWAGYSHFFAGRFVDETGDDPDQDWVFLQVTVEI